MCVSDSARRSSAVPEMNRPCGQPLCMLRKACPTLIILLDERKREREPLKCHHSESNGIIVTLTILKVMGETTRDALHSKLPACTQFTPFFIVALYK